MSSEPGRQLRSPWPPLAWGSSAGAGHGRGAPLGVSLPPLPSQVCIFLPSLPPRRFIPRHEDELELDVDDPILVELEEDDYWYRGYNMRTGERGIFPAFYAHEVVGQARDVIGRKRSQPRGCLWWAARGAGGGSGGAAGVLGTISPLLSCAGLKRNPCWVERFNVQFLGSVEVPYHQGNGILCAAMQKVRLPGGLAAPRSPPLSMQGPCCAQETPSCCLPSLGLRVLRGHRPPGAFSRVWGWLCAGGPSGTTRPDAPSPRPQIATTRKLTVHLRPPASCDLEITLQGIKLILTVNEYGRDEEVRGRRGQGVPVRVPPARWAPTPCRGFLLQFERCSHFFQMKNISFCGCHPRNSW